MKAELRPIKIYSAEGESGGVVYEILSHISEDTDIDGLSRVCESKIEELVNEYSENSEVVYDLRHASAIKGKKLKLVKGLHTEIIHDKDKNEVFRAARRVSIPYDLHFPIKFVSLIFYPED